MISLKNYTDKKISNDDVLNFGHMFTKCIDTSIRNMNYGSKEVKLKANLLVHDGYKITLLKVNYDNSIIVRMGGNVITTTLADLLYNVMYIYKGKDTLDAIRRVSSDNLWAFNIRALYQDLEYMGNMEYSNDAYIVFLPEDVFTIVEALGLDSTTFTNDILFPIVDSILISNFTTDRVKTVVDYAKSLYVVDYFLDVEMYYNSENIIKAAIARNANLAVFGLHCMVVDLIDKAIVSEHSGYSKHSAAKYIVFNNKVKSNIKSLITAIDAYKSDYTKNPLRQLHTQLSNSTEPFGLFTALFLNRLESEISNISIKSLENINASNVLRINEANANSILTDIYNELVERANKGESVALASIYSEAQSIPSELWPTVSYSGMLTNNSIIDKVNTMTTNNRIEPNVIEPVLVKSEDGTEDVPNLQGIHRMNFTRFNNTLTAYRDIKVFDNPEEKAKMVEKMIQLIDDISNTKQSFDRSNLLEYAPKVDLSIYDLLIEESKRHIDYLNNIKYYGDSEEIANLNDTAYLSTTSENFNYISMPLEYFPGIDKAFGELRIFGGTESVGKNLANNTGLSRMFAVKDRDGNIVRKRGDKKYFNSLDDTNMTNKEVYNMYKDTAITLKYGTGVFRYAAYNTDEFFGFLNNLLYGILNALTFGRVNNTNGAVYAGNPLNESYLGEVILYNDRKLSYSEAVDKYYQFSQHNPVSTTGDKIDSVINAPINLVTGTVKAVAGPIASTVKTAGYIAWVTAKIAFIYTIVRPIIKLLNRALKGENKYAKFFKDKHTVILKGKRDALAIIKDIRQRAQGVLSKSDMRKLSSLEMELGENLEIDANIAEAFDINTVNVLSKSGSNSKNIIQLTTVKDVEDLSIKLINSIHKYQKDIIVNSISYNEHNGFWAILSTNKGKSVFNLTSNYTPIPDSIRDQLHPINTRTGTVVISAYDMDLNVLQNLINSKVDTNIDDSKIDIETALSSNLPEDRMNSIVKEYEDSVLEKLNNKLGKERGNE